MRIKTLRPRTATRIAARRAGAFNTRGYRDTKARSNEFCSELGFWGGVALTLLTGGAALPVAAIVMAPKILNTNAPKKISTKSSSVAKTPKKNVNKSNSKLEPKPVAAAPAPAKPKKEPKNHQTRLQEKQRDINLDARKKRLARLRRENCAAAAEGRLSFFRSTR